MANANIEPVLLASRTLPFEPLRWSELTGTRWLIRSSDRMQAVLLDQDFGFVRRFDFSTLLGDSVRAKRTINVSPDGTTAVAIRWPDVIVQIRSRKTTFSTPPGDTGLASHALVLDDACYFVQPPSSLTENNEIDDHALVKLDYATGEVTEIAAIPTHGDYVVLAAGDSLAVVAHDGQHGATTVRVDLATGESEIMPDVGVSAFAPDFTWFVGGGDAITSGAWPSGSAHAQRRAEGGKAQFPVVLGQDRIATWEVDTRHVLVLNPQDLDQPLAQIELPAGHRMHDAHGDRLVTTHETSAYLWSIEVS